MPSTNGTVIRGWNVLTLKQVTALPEVITQKQVFQIIDACQTFRTKAFIWVTYTLGLRIGEAVNLHVGDIDSESALCWT